MELMLDDKFKIVTDSSLQNYILMKLEDIKNKKTNEIRQDWISLGFFGHSLHSVLKRYRDESLISLGNVTLDEVLNKLTEMDSHIDKVVKADKIKLVSKE
jgi:hypothetical protein